jgi:hypothetical protein
VPDDKDPDESWRVEMSTSKAKPTRWYYVLAVLIPIFACLGTALVVYASVPQLPGALEALGMKNLTQVVVPGSAEIHFPKPGAYAVYYEYRSVVDGVSYFSDERPPRLTCELRSRETGDAVALATSTVEGDVYTYPERAGVMFRRISIDQPGLYDFSCRYPHGGSTPKRVMAVGPNLIWEFFNVAAKPVAAIISGGLVFVCACGLSMLIIGIVAYRRHRSKDALAVGR